MCTWSDLLFLLTYFLRSRTFLPEVIKMTISETLYLLSIPGMLESLPEGMKTPLEECREEAGW